jgi:apolipoprotein N-acyltransferase
MVIFSFAPYDCGFLMWVAFVPTMLAVALGKQSKRNGLLFMAAGFAVWLVGADWLRNIAVAAWIAAAFILSFKWLLLYSLLRYLHGKRVPFTFSFPIVLVGLEGLQGWLFGGFDWNFAAHSQYKWPIIIQIADITGAAGVSFLLGAVNGYFVDLILLVRKMISLRSVSGNWRVVDMRPVWKAVAPVLVSELFVVTCLLVVFFYGKKQLAGLELTEGPLVGIVQPDIPSSAKIEMVSADEVLERLITQTKLCRKESGADVIAWPETMIPTVMNIEYVSCLREGSFGRDVYNELRMLTREEDFSLIAGAPTATLAEREGRLWVDKEYNSAVCFDRGTLLPNRYDKIHLVPFGEYIPFAEKGLFKDFIMRFNSEGYDFVIDRGEALNRFATGSVARQITIAPSICYEDTDAELTRRAVDAASCKPQLLLNISNDGWYVKTDGSRSIGPGKEHFQRLAICVFRAVENRVSLVRSVNTGVSCLIDPLGRIIDSYAFGNLPEKVKERGASEGWFADYVPQCEKVSVFARTGNRLGNMLRAVVIGLFAAMMIETAAGKIGARKKQMEK